eukprot:RCo021747
MFSDLGDSSRADLSSLVEALKWLPADKEQRQQYLVQVEGVVDSFLEEFERRRGTSELASGLSLLGLDFSRAERSVADSPCPGGGGRVGGEECGGAAPGACPCEPGPSGSHTVDRSEPSTAADHGAQRREGAISKKQSDAFYQRCIQWQRRLRGEAHDKLRQKQSDEQAQCTFTPVVCPRPGSGSPPAAPVGPRSPPAASTSTSVADSVTARLFQDGVARHKLKLAENARRKEMLLCEECTFQPQLSRLSADSTVSPRYSRPPAWAPVNRDPKASEQPTFRPRTNALSPSWTSAQEYLVQPFHERLFSADAHPKKLPSSASRAPSAQPLQPASAVVSGRSSLMASAICSAVSAAHTAVGETDTESEDFCTPEAVPEEEGGDDLSAEVAAAAAAAFGCPSLDSPASASPEQATAGALEGDHYYRSLARKTALEVQQIDAMLRDGSPGGDWPSKATRSGAAPARVESTSELGSSLRPTSTPIIQELPELLHGLGFVEAEYESSSSCGSSPRVLDPRGRLSSAKGNKRSATTVAPERTTPRHEQPHPCGAGKVSPGRSPGHVSPCVRKVITDKGEVRDFSSFLNRQQARAAARTEAL